MKSKVITALLMLAVLLTGCQKENPTEALYQEVKSVDKLVLASMAITKTAKTERTDWYKVGKRIAVYSYDSYMRAWIDLSELQSDDINVDEASKTVTITLPPVRTEITGRDMEMRKEYENIGLMRSNVGSQERAEIKEIANESFTREVANNPTFRQHLVSAAERRARIYFENVLGAEGYNVNVEFKNPNLLEINEK